MGTTKTKREEPNTCLSRQVAEHRAVPAKPETRAAPRCASISSRCWSPLSWRCSAPPSWCRPSRFPRNPWSPRCWWAIICWSTNSFSAGATTGMTPLLPYRDVRRGDVIVFKFPYQDHPHYVKRVIGVPGDRIKIVDQQVYRQRPAAKRAVRLPRSRRALRSVSLQFSAASRDELLSNMQPEWADQIFQLHPQRRNHCAARQLFRHGRQSRPQLGQPLLGLRGSRSHHGPPGGHLLVGGNR